MLVTYITMAGVQGKMSSRLSYYSEASLSELLEEIFPRH